MPVYHVSGLAAAIRNLCGGSASKSFFLFCCEKHTITPLHICKYLQSSENVLQLAFSIWYIIYS